MKKYFFPFSIFFIIAANVYAKDLESKNSCVRVNLPLSAGMTDNCSDISPNGSGSKYQSIDGNLEISIWYHADKSISGEVKALVDGKYISAPIIKDTLRHPSCSYGNLAMSWEAPGFSGYITGDIRGGAQMIRNVCAKVNDKKISPDFIFKNYI